MWVTYQAVLHNILKVAIHEKLLHTLTYSIEMALS